MHYRVTWDGYLVRIGITTRYWIKIRSYENCRIAKQAFQWSIELSESGIKNWSWQIKKLLMYVRMPNLYNMRFNIMDYSFKEIYYKRSRPRAGAIGTRAFIVHKALHTMLYLLHVA